jgi:hypothetical protein
LGRTVTEAWAMLGRRGRLRHEERIGVGPNLQARNKFCLGRYLAVPLSRCTTGRIAGLGQLRKDPPYLSMPKRSGFVPVQIHRPKRTSILVPKSFD